VREHPPVGAFQRAELDVAGQRRQALHARDQRVVDRDACGDQGHGLRRVHRHHDHPVGLAVQRHHGGGAPLERARDEVGERERGLGL
jgi:hypothetical protein